MLFVPPRIHEIFFLLQFHFILGWSLSSQWPEDLSTPSSPSNSLSDASSTRAESRGRAADKGQCIALNANLVETRACRCFDRQNDDGSESIWVGCTQAGMPDIEAALLQLTRYEDLLVDKLWLWDNVIPVVHATFFGRLAAKKLVLESSLSGLIEPEALSHFAPHLQSLEIRKSLISSLEPSLFANMTDLKLLDLSGNRLSRLGNGTFSHLVNLVELSITHNSIGLIEPEAFSGLKNLKSLNLAFNQLETLHEDTFKNLPSLRVLNLQGNSLRVVSGQIFGQLSLDVLNMAGNKITDLELTAMTALRKLDLTNNSISHMDSVVLGHVQSNMKTLHLDNNNLRHLRSQAFENLSQLTVLSLTENHIARLEPDSFAGLASLKILSLQQNNLSHLPLGLFSPTPAIQRLFLSHNNLDYIGKTDFRPLQRLQSLTLAQNHLSNVNCESIQVQQLVLSSNRLRALDKSCFEGDTLQRLDISNNPLPCNCENAELFAWMGENQERVASLDKTLCGGSVPVLYAGPEVVRRCEHLKLNRPKRRETNVWITTLGVVLGLLSILILAGIGIMFWQDQLKRPVTVRRVPSDMITLLVPKD